MNTTKALFSFLGLGFAVACGSGSGVVPPDPPGNGDDDPPPTGEYALVWQDEFEGTTLDATKWEVQVGDGCDLGICGWGNNELQWYQAANATVSGGVLTITAREESAGGKSFTSTRLRTKNKGDWKYARIEARARLPQGRGLWPAIWMLPTDETYGGWPASGEIDIMELVGHEPATVHGTLHYQGAGGGHMFTGTSYSLGLGTFADDFHVFAIEWEEGVIRWYVDDVLYQTQSSWSPGSFTFPAPFDQRFHLLVNVAVGGNWPGSPDGSTVFPQTLEVDWIRVYQRQ